ncbi:hypothetical protein ABZP36_002472 [Zizania latifolia]
MVATQIFANRPSAGGCLGAARGRRRERVPTSSPRRCRRSPTPHGAVAFVPLTDHRRHTRDTVIRRFSRLVVDELAMDPTQAEFQYGGPITPCSTHITTPPTSPPPPPPPSTPSFSMSPPFLPKPKKLPEQRMHSR